MLVASAGRRILALRPDPLLVAREAARARWRRGVDAGTVLVASGSDGGPRRGPAVAGRGPRGSSCAHAVMIAVMVMTPLHMDHGGATLEIIGVVISLHVLGMYAFAPLVGCAADGGAACRCWPSAAVMLLVALVLSGALAGWALVRGSRRAVPARARLVALHDAGIRAARGADADRRPARTYKVRPT